MTTNSSPFSKSISNDMSNAAAATNDTSNGATDPANFTDKDCCFGKEQDSSNWSSVCEDASFSRNRSESKLSLEGFDLELPTLEMYQEEFVDFPSSPTHENFQQHMLGGEHDSGNADESEEEEEDTSIYRAVLSPNCQDVRLCKGVTSVVTPTTPSTTIVPGKSGFISTGSSVNGGRAGRRRKILSTDPEVAELPDIGGIPTIVDYTSCDLNLMAVSLQKCTNSFSEIKPMLSQPFIETGSNEDNSDFVFERRDSKRLSEYQLGERIIEGLFVESRNKDSGSNSGKRKISVPDEVMSCPESGAQYLLDSFGKDIIDTDQSRMPQFRTKKCLTLTNSNCGLGWPISASKSKQYLCDSESSKVNIPPCSKSQAENITPVTSDASNKLLQLHLKPSTLSLQSSLQGLPSTDPNGIVGVEERPGSLISSQCGGRRRIRVTADILCGHGKEDKEADDDEEEYCNASSVGGRSSQLSDADLLSPGEDDADLDAFLSPGVDTPDQLEDSIIERLGEAPPMTLSSAAVPIPELTAAEERVESRNWRSCIVQGVERRIDMKVIEPYKRVLSHGGYLTAGSHNAIIVFSACFLPDRSRVDYDYVMDNLFLYVLTTLDQLITEDYVLIYLHGATQRSCMPTFTWLKRCYQLIDRRLRKNLKGLYLVHPTFWLKTIVLMTKPFISSKFTRKLRFVDTLSELATVVPLEQASIPDRVKQLDHQLQEKCVKRGSLLSWWWTQTPDVTSVSS